MKLFEFDSPSLYERIARLGPKARLGLKMLCGKTKSKRKFPAPGKREKHHRP